MILQWKDLQQINPVLTQNLPQEGTITGVQLDSRVISKNMLFIARRGEQTDGHNFIPAALENGAGASVVEHQWYVTAAPAKDWPLIVVEDSDEALRELARICRAKFDGPVLGITGSNGKTTTKEMVTAVLGQKYSVLSTPGNFNNLWGLPLTILQAQEDHDFWVLEHGMNRPGEISELCKISTPTAGLITTIAEVHSMNFDSIDGIAREKYALFESLPGDGVTFQNLDDPYIRKMEPPSSKTVTYSLEEEADIRGQIVEIDEFNRPTLRAEATGEIQLQVFGEFQALNALATTAVGLTYEIDGNSIREALESFQPVSGRATLLEKNGYTIIDDSYNANPTSMRRAIDLLSKIPSQGRRIAILGDMLELGENRDRAHKDLGKYAGAHNVDILIGVGALAEMILSGAGNGVAKYYFADHIDCIAALRNLVQTGDVILVKGSHGIHLEKVVEAL